MKSEFKKKIFGSLYISFCIIFIFSNISYGYLDPSAMTYLIQIISAIVIGLSTFIGVLMYKLKKFFSKKKNKNVKMNIDEVINESKENKEKNS